VNDSVVPSSFYSAVSPSVHPGRFHPDGVPRDVITRLDPGAALIVSLLLAVGLWGTVWPAVSAFWPRCGLGNADIILRAKGGRTQTIEGGPNAVDVERSLGVARPRRGSAGGSWAIDRSWRKESGLGACRKLGSARPSRCNPACAPGKEVGEERPRTKLVITPMRSVVEQQGASGFPNTYRITVGSFTDPDFRLEVVHHSFMEISHVARSEPSPLRIVFAENEPEGARTEGSGDAR